jgi:anti-sigma-K factor RskA/putative zinc finger protein
VSSCAHELACERLPECAAYVLGALEEPEVAALRVHLDECPACRTEVAHLQLVADLLAGGVPRVTVPESLRARVVGTAHAEADLRGAAGRGVVGRGVVGHGVARRGVAGREAAGREVGGAAPARVRGTSTLRRLVPALAGALAVGVGLLIGALAFKGEPSERTEVIPAAVVAPGYHATAELRKVGSHLELVVVGMPAPPPGRIYEVWLEHGTAAPAPTDALFSVTRSGDGSVGVPGNLRGVSRVLVTDEPLGGSLKPTRTPVIVGSI